MTDRVSEFIQPQTPGDFIRSKQTVITPSFPADFFISHCYINPSPLRHTALSLPVTALTHTLSAHNLGHRLKSLWMIRMCLFFPRCVCHLPVPLRQRQLSVRCVWIQCEPTAICTSEALKRLIIMINIHLIMCVRENEL